MWLDGVGQMTALATEPAGLGTALLGALLTITWQSRRRAGERRQAERLEAELMAYMLLDDWRVGDARAMGRRICRTIARHSAFGTAALLVRDRQGRLGVTASTRTDDLTVAALERWAETEAAEERQRRAKPKRSAAGGEPRARLLQLERRSGYRAGDPAALAWCTALVVPMCNQRGLVTGAIAVCADRFAGRPARALEQALEPLEALAARFAEGAAALAPERAMQTDKGRREEPEPVASLAAVLDRGGSLRAAGAARAGRTHHAVVVRLAAGEREANRV